MNNTAEEIKGIEIGFIPRENIRLVWDSVSPMIMKVINRPNCEYNLGDVYDSLIDGRAWLVCVTDNSNLIACFVCKQADYQHKRVLLIILVAGYGINDWKHEIVQFMKEGARNIGASEIECRGRKGFEKIFKGIAEFKHIALVIPVENNDG